MMWIDKDLKKKENKRKIKKGKWLRERNNHLNKWRKCRKDKRGGSLTKKSLSSSSSFSLLLPIFSFYIIQN